MPTTSTPFVSLCLLEAPVEATSSFQRGSVLGPPAVADELERIDRFDADVGRGLTDSTRLHRATLSASERSFDCALPALESQARLWSDRDAFVLTLGGEHTVTLGPLRAAASRWGRLGLVQLDAHGDLRDTYEGESVSHACVMRRAIDELDVRLLGIGIRSLCEEEAELAASNPGIDHVHPRHIDDGLSPIVDLVEALPPLVYLTIDMDVFDPAVAPGVGTPEPGGLSWFQVSELIDLIASRRRIIGADLVELAPTIERDRTVRLAARVALRVLLRSMV